MTGFYRPQFIVVLSKPTTVMFKFLFDVVKTIFRFIFGIVAFVIAILLDSTPD